MSSHGSNNYNNYQQITPKITNITWDSLLESEFRTWASQVRAANISYYGEDGLKLESFIDFITKRAVYSKAAAQQTIHPALLGLEECTHEGTEDTEPYPEAEPEDGSINNEGDEESVARSPDLQSHRMPSSPAVSYRDGSRQVTTLRGIGSKTMELNYALYNTMVNIVTGPKLASIRALPDQHKTYTSVMIMLFHDDEMNHTNRKIEAFTLMNNFQYEGDARVWSMGFQNIVREIFESNLTIEDVIMFSLKRMFETKVPAIRDMITLEINKEATRRHEGDETPINFSQLAIKFEQQLLTASSMASSTSINYAPKSKNELGRKVTHDLTGHPVDPAAANITCGNCKAVGHHYRRNCPFPDHGELCTICGNKGHNASKCRKKAQIAQDAPASHDRGEALMASISEAFYNLGNKGNSKSVNYTIVDEDPADAPTTEMIIQSIHEQFPASNSPHPDEDQMKAKMESIQRVFDSLGKPEEVEELTAESPLEDAKQDETQVKAQSVESSLVTPKPPEAIDVGAAFMVGPLEDLLPSENTPAEQTDLHEDHEDYDSDPPTLVSDTSASLPSSDSSTESDSDEEIEDIDDIVATLEADPSDPDDNLLLQPPTDGSVSCFATSAPAPPEITPQPVGMGHQSVVLSLCDGIGGLAASIKKAGIRNITRYIAVEKDEIAKRIANHAHPRTEDFCGIDHAIDDIFDIDEDFIASLPKGSLILVGGGGECKDFSKLRLLRDNRGKGKFRMVFDTTKDGGDARGTDPRPGLQGKSGRTVLQIIRIWQWCIKHHPNAALLKENVVFNDMPCDWDFVNTNLGEPLIINSQDYSTTKRNRAYWHNSELLRREPYAWVEEGMSPINPDSCMDRGRTIIRYQANGQDCVRPLSASWKGDPANPECASQRKNMVTDEKFPGEYFEIRPIEAERLMGFPEDCTDAPDVTAKDRLKALGNSWDINITAPLVKTILTSSDRITQMNLMVPKVLTEDDIQQYEVAKAFFTSDEAARSHVLSKVTHEQLCKMTALYTQFPNGLPINIGYADGSKGSVIDSGAGRHVCKAAVVTNADETVRLRGFDGSTAWTSGKGYLPAKVQNRMGDYIDVDINDVENFPGAAAELLSMGKLIRAGWEFRLSNQNLEAIIPGGHKVQLNMNSEDVLMMPHKIRTGKDALPLTGAPTSMNFIDPNPVELKPEPDEYVVDNGQF